MLLLNVAWLQISSNGTHNLLNRTSTGRNNISWKNTTFSFETYQSLAQEADSLVYTEFMFMDNNGAGKFTSYYPVLMQKEDRYYDNRGNFFKESHSDNYMSDGEEESFIRSNKYNPCFVFLFSSRESDGEVSNRTVVENWCKKVKSVTMYQVAGYPDHVNKILVPEKTLTVNSVFKDQYDTYYVGTYTLYFIGIKLNGSFVSTDAPGDNGYFPAYAIYRFNP